MKVIILRNKAEFEKISRKDLFSSGLVGYWNKDSTFTICKDRYYGRSGIAVSERELNEYLKRFA